MGKGRFLFAKAKHLLIPYVFWTVLLWGGVQIVNNISTSISQRMVSIGFGPMSVKGLITGLLTYEEYYTEHLWFLYVLFLFFLVHTFLGKAGSLRICSIIGIIIGLFTVFVDWPDIIERAMIWFVFFSFGRLIAYDKCLAKRISNFDYKSVVLVIVSFALFSIIRLYLEFDELTINIYLLKTAKQIVKYVIGFQGVWLLYGLAKLLIERNCMVADVTKRIGDFSYDIYLMHNPYIVALGCTVLSSIIGLNPLITIVVATAAGVVIPMIISKFVIGRFHFLSKIMFGR